jgi:hypothetical protein
MRSIGDPGVGGERPTEATEKASQGQGHLPSDQAPSIIEKAEAAGGDAVSR